MPIPHRPGYFFVGFPAGLKVASHNESSIAARVCCLPVPACHLPCPGGGYKLDAAFASGPDAFAAFARRLWEQYKNR
ncbi:MAG: hypothetical protein FWG59_03780 [Betaproteobacteria bacterium]|nr:hypothetical protein [Betaproteobacteria bacterium]